MSETTIEKILKTGIKKVKTDGVETEFVSPGEMRKQARHDDKNANKKRPAVSSINMSNT